VWDPLWEDYFVGPMRKLVNGMWEKGRESSLTAFMIALLKYGTHKGINDRTGSHHDPPKYEAIVGVTLEGSG